ncbi:hypothetical protein COO60DRAFT_699338 [Scenedesmus sp. NREL 46B-D3]|nr:hypothetical protein COO60DRAFT_699338 [Scenedesmus sp. NREL 46B-D3]
MRLKRTRQATKQHQGTVYVDLDSDEFEEVLAGDQVAAARPLKRCKVSSSSGALQEHVQQQEQEVSAAAATEAEEPAAAAAAADLLHVADEQGTESAHEEEELELVECSEDPACDDYSDSNRFNDSGICSSSCSEFECSEPEEEAAAAHPKAGKQQQQQQLPSKQKEKKPRKKRQSTRRLCASYAKAQFRLTDADLKKLKDVKCEPNPHYPGGYPMKLYLVRELEELARAKQESKARLAGDKEERAAARALEARARKVAAAAAAAQTAQLFGSRGPREERHGSLQLPDTCLASIMAHLAGSMQPGGLRGPSCVAGELAQASLVCWDFYHAAHQGFQALAQATDSLQQHPPPQCLESKLLHGLAALPGPAALGGWAFWDSVVQQPASLKLTQLKDAARQLGVMVTGTKAELMLRLLGGFGLAAPSRAPARLLRALQLERSTQYDAWDGPEAASLRMSISACCLYSEELSPQRKIAAAKVGLCTLATCVYSARPAAGAAWSDACTSAVHHINFVQH